MNLRIQPAAATITPAPQPASYPQPEQHPAKGGCRAALAGILGWCRELFAAVRDFIAPCEFSIGDLRGYVRPCAICLVDIHDAGEICPEQWIGVCDIHVKTVSLDHFGNCGEAPTDYHYHFITDRRRHPLAGRKQLEVIRTPT